MKNAPFVFVPLLVCLLNSCGHNKPPAVEPDRDYASSHYVRRLNAETVIVFVHGIFGGAIGTWTNGDTGAYWPQLLTADPSFQNTDVYVYSYSTPYLAQSYAIDELIEHMRLVFANDEIFQKHKRVVFLCHSMGGLVVRGFLKRYQANAPQVPLIYFFSSPTSGVHITKLARFLSDNPQLRGMLPANSENYVSNLQRDWRALPFRVNSRCAYEKLDTYGYRIVDEQSASALCDGPVDPIDANHINIVKPADPTALSYIAFRQSFASIQQASAPPETTVSGTVQTARTISVDCGQVRDDTATIPPPIEIQPQQKVVEAIASLQEASNLKEQQVEAKGLLNQMARIHYRLVGLDLLASGACPGKGFGIILVTFILAQPSTMSTPGFTPISSTDPWVGLSGKSGTLTISEKVQIPSIDTATTARFPALTREQVQSLGTLRETRSVQERKNWLNSLDSQLAKVFSGTHRGEGASLASVIADAPSGIESTVPPTSPFRAALLRANYSDDLAKLRLTVRKLSSEAIGLPTEKLEKLVAVGQAFNDYQLASALVSRRLEESPYEPRLLVANGLIRFGQGEYREAASSFSRAQTILTSGVAPDQLRASISANRALALLATGETRGAEPILVDSSSLSSEGKQPELASYLLQILAILYRDTGQIQKAIEKAQEVERASKQIGQTEEGRSYRLQAELNLYRGETPKSFEQVNKAISLHEANGATLDLAADLSVKGDISVLGDLEAALRLFQKSFNLYEMLGDRKGKAIQALKIAFLIGETGGEYDKALHSASIGCEVFSQIGDSNGIGQCLWLKGRITLRRVTKKYDGLQPTDLPRVKAALTEIGEARRHYQDSLDVFARTGYKRGGADAYKDLCATFFSIPAIAEPTKALGHCKNALRVYKEVEYPKGVADVHGNLGVVYRQLEQYPSAQQNLEEALSIHQKIGNRLGEGRQLLNLGRYFAMRSRYDSARTYLKNARQILAQIGANYEVQLADELLGAVEKE